MKKIILGVVCGMALLSSVSSTSNVAASSQVSSTDKQNLQIVTPFDIGYFSDYWVGHSPKSLDPNPRIKLTSGAPVNITITINKNSVPVKCRAYSPSTGQAGPWVYIGVTGSAQLPNSIPAGQTVVPQAMSTSIIDGAYISGNWYHN